MALREHRHQRIHRRCGRVFAVEGVVIIERIVRLKSIGIDGKRLLLVVVEQESDSRFGGFRRSRVAIIRATIDKHEHWWFVGPVQSRFDVRGTPSYVEEWCVSLRLGTDGELSIRGFSRFQCLDRYSEYAELMKWRRKLRNGTKEAEMVGRLLNGAAGYDTQDDYSASEM